VAADVNADTVVNTLERVMNFEPDIEWFPDAGLPRRSLAKMGGITEISRWYQLPDMHGKCGEPR
jgi:hypothetical protein